jgi:hypothetical protein
MRAIMPDDLLRWWPWSIAVPGLGQLFQARITGLFWFVVVCMAYLFSSPFAAPLHFGCVVCAALGARRLRKQAAMFAFPLK